MSGQQVKFRVGDVIKPVCWRVPKAKFAVVIRVYTGGALLTNDMEPLIANREAIEKEGGPPGGLSNGGNAHALLSM